MAYADYAQQAQVAADAYGVPWPIFRGLIQQESNWNPSALSPAGAYGLTQLMPGTAADMGANPYVVQQNISGGAKYLRQLYDQFGNWTDAIAAYNSGPTRQSKVLAGTSQMPAETVDYVKAVTANAKSYGWDGSNGTTLTGGDVNSNGNNTRWIPAANQDVVEGGKHVLDLGTLTGSPASPGQPVGGVIGQIIDGIKSFGAGLAAVDKATSTPGNAAAALTGNGLDIGALASSMFTAEFWQKAIIYIAAVLLMLGFLIYGGFRIVKPN